METYTERSMETSSEMSLAGQWTLKEDRNREGVARQWYLQDFTAPITIPGTMEENGYGDIPQQPSAHDLNHSYFYRGWAWYQTDFTLSGEQASQNISLYLEHIQWDSFIWIDGQYIGNQNSLSVPHCYRLPKLSCGSHRLVILIDNSNLNTNAQLPDSPDAEGTDAQGRKISLHLHTAADGTKKLACGIHGDGYAFNGIVGEVKLIFQPQLSIRQADLYPDIHTKTLTAKISLQNTAQLTGTARLSVSCEHASCEADVFITGSAQQDVELKLFFRDQMRLWDEFDPYVYTFTVTCCLDNKIDIRTIRCGLRELKADGRHLFINGNRLFFRSTLEGCAFPLTGYTPMDQDFWLRAFKILKSYGLNGMRMHTFIPPKAAFDAAEQIGFYLQIELPGTSCPEADEAPAVTAFLWEELKKALARYGNYACFLFLSMGNEQLISSKKDFVMRHQKLLMEKVEYAKQTDPRHLYTCTSHNHTDGRNDDIFVVATKDELVLNGIQWGGPDPITTSRFSLRKPSTMENYQEGIVRMDRPSITHEVGQWAVYPNFAEMSKYTGILKPRNYEIFASQLAQNGLLEQNADFVKNSGMLSLLLYKEEIESALRTPDLSGFELLDIHDYPGQGTSTVGTLDCFFDSKGLITPEEYRHFCAPAVALCAFEKYVYTAGETLTVTPMIANYSRKSIQTAACLTLTLPDGTVVYEQTFDAAAVIGQLTEFAPHKISLDCQKAVQATLKLELAGTSLENSWPIWIYPQETASAKNTVSAQDAPIIVTALDETSKQLLQEGKDLLYLHPYGTHPKNGVQGSFTSQFWNPFMKPQETANGILCDPTHPLFADFPTDSHTNYQWWEIVKEAYFMYLDALPLDFFPIVQIIPGIKENRKMGLIWECKAANGRLLICTADLRSCKNRPAARQLLSSIQQYMNSTAFAPKQELTLDVLRTVLQ